jgi:hypothetical protein
MLNSLVGFSILIELSNGFLLVLKIAAKIYQFFFFRFCVCYFVFQIIELLNNLIVWVISRCNQYLVCDFLIRRTSQFVCFRNLIYVF